MLRLYKNITRLCTPNSMLRPLEQSLSFEVYKGSPLDPQYNRGSLYDDTDAQLKFGWDDVLNNLADSHGPLTGIVYASQTTATDTV